MAKTKQFKTESKKLLDLMINSIYTHKEIFLRELISNASDAIDKRHYLSLTNADLMDDYQIVIDLDEEARTITISDNGVGFTEDELINNLGVIARSGSKEFKDGLDNDDLEIIGQFGVGFYSAFMVSKKVTVLTKSVNSDQAYKWTSEGTSSYTISNAEKDEPGTTIILSVRDNNEELEDNYDEYLREYSIKNLVKKYSDYVRYPIKMDITKTDYPEDEKGKAIEYSETEVLNSMIPIWKKSKSDIKEEDLNEFYKHQFNDYTDPLKVIHSKVEGLTTYTSLLFIPKKPPVDLYSEKFEKGLQLYSKGVFIMDKNKQLIPDYFRFVRGLVDSSDLSLNISREMLQHDRQLKKIASHLEKKIKNELEKMQKNERELYNEFYTNYGVNLKYGIYEGYGVNKELLQDLIMFKTSKSDDFVTLKEYTKNIKEEQKYIYYASGKNKQSILSLPQMDLIKDKDYEVLLFTDDIDEFMVSILMKYNDLEFKNVAQGDLDLIDESEIEKFDELEKEKKSLLDLIKESLTDKVTDVKLSKRLKDSPVCLVSGEGLSMEMEKVLKNMPTNPDVKASKILEINPNHDLFKTLEKVNETNPDKVKEYAKILYSQALLIEGLPLENPVEFSNLMVKLMVDANKE
ncbi:MAG: Chaperone protein HtpG [Candidatus Izimaplasma bacterium HR2]|nr:MAG: Chaperone protein HtpG [Candidatus Izimaplasma bacterium HR2]